MAELAWVLLFGLLMSAIALVGSVTVLLRKETLERCLLPLVAFAAGSLIGGAIFHMLPAAVEQMGNRTVLWIWGAAHDGEPLTWLILLADGLHNLLGGLSIGAVFAIDLRLGITAWLAAAAHEVPQELGDFGVLVHAGWSRRRALLWNLLSASTFPVGMLLAWSISGQMDTAWLITFGAGNFVYIGCADLIPEVKHSESTRRTLEHFACFLGGLALLLALRVAFHG